VTEALEERRYEVELVTVETTGDQIRDELLHRLGKTRAFVRELDERVLEEDRDHVEVQGSDTEAYVCGCISFPEVLDRAARNGTEEPGLVGAL